MSDTLNIHRQFHNGIRTNRAWWNCKTTGTGQWQIHFFADYVESEDCVANDVTLFEVITQQHAKWIAAMEARAK